jgi:purine nucleoside permease
LKDSAAAKSYREQYPQPMARRSPAITLGTHMTGDTFYHGLGLSEQAQYITELYGANDYMITEMETVAIAQILNRMVGMERVMSLRVPLILIRVIRTNRH